MASSQFQPDASPPIRVEATVVRHQHESPVNHVLELDVAGWPGGRPGQFLMISPGPLGGALQTDPLLPRPMAVYRQLSDSRAPGSTRIQVLYKVEGRGTRLLAASRPGDRVSLVGPLGQGFPEIAAGQQAILVGGGTGVASLYELAEGASEKAAVQIILGARSAADLMGADDFRALGADLLITTEDGSLGTQGRVTDRLRPLLEAAAGTPDADRSVVYACGPTAMMRACAELAAASGIRCLVSLENNMACGFGVCLGCASPSTGGGYELVCKAGPVFDAEAVDWGRMP